jgi:hypothetical protein
LCCYNSKISKKNPAHLAKDKGIKDKGVFCTLSVIWAYQLKTNVCFLGLVLDWICEVCSDDKVPCESPSDSSSTNIRGIQTLIKQ